MIDASLAAMLPSMLPGASLVQPTIGPAMPSTVKPNHMTAAQLAASAGTESTAGTAFNVASTQLATAGSAATSYVTKQPAGHVSVHTAGAHVSGVHVPTAVDVNRQAWITPSSYVHEPAAVHGPSPLAA